jgi:hypothetical protein
MPRTLAVVVLASLFSFASVAFAQAPIPIYVTSAGASNGFTDPSKDNRDTVKDLLDDLKDYKELRIVQSADEASIVLTVLGREASQSSAPGVTGGLLDTNARDRIIHVKFQAGAFETTLTASAPGNTTTSNGAWSKAAGKVAKQVREWAVANRAQLAAQK